MHTTQGRDYAADTHRGLRREANEDCYAADPDLGLWLLADGMGGQPCGDVASATVCRVVRARVLAGDSLVEAVRASHAALQQHMSDHHETRGMGSTVVALRLQGDDYQLCWVGDSRAYLWDGALHPLTQDHNRAAELVAAGRISPGQAASHPQRHQLTRGLGVVPGGPAPEPGQLSGRLDPAARLLLCSDGLSGELSDSVIEHLMGRHASPRAQVDALISAALDAGGRDNITAIVVGEEAPTVQPEVPTPRHSASGGRPNDGRFPLRALLLLGALGVLASLVAVGWLL